MSIANRLVLPADVKIIPVELLHHTDASHLNWQPGQFVVLRPGGRASAKLIEHEAADLLAKFRTPTTIVEAILAYSREAGKDPEIVLEDVFTLIQSFRASSYLISEDSPLVNPITASCVPGDRIGIFTLLEAVHVLEDTEVYRGCDPEGVPVAIKIARCGHSPALVREADILEHLQGIGTPMLIQRGEDKGRQFLVMAWIEGENSWRAAGRLRVHNPDQLLELCIAIVNAYIRLHEHGVLHGDVHPKNIRVDAQGTITLIDFGFARRTDVEQTSFWRGAFPQFCDPEYAEAMLAGMATPPVTSASEQYTIAATLYYLITGKYYLNFHSDRDMFFRQIMSEEPLSFVAQNIQRQSGLEAVLGRALQKQPQERFPSLKAFLEELCAATLRRTTTLLQSERAVFVKQYGLSSYALIEGLTTAPACSINMGAAGIAYAFYRMACIEESADLLAAADLWINNAKRHAVRSDAFINPSLDIIPEITGPVSLYHTISGVYCIDALVQTAFGNMTAAHQAVYAFVEASQLPCSHLDITLGISSTLLGCSILLEAIPGREELLHLGDSTLHQLWKVLDMYLPVGDDTHVPWLGMAHGWAGFLFATLRWCQISGTSLPEQVAVRLSELAACALGTDQQRCWPRRPPAWNEPPVLWKGWCHGSAGYVHLWLRAAAMLNDARWLNLAVAAGRHAADMNNAGTNLCCGLTGQAYAMLALYQHTNNTEWLDIALSMTSQAQKLSTKATMIAGSLYKGDVGLALLEADLTCPRYAVMPVFG